MSSESELYHIEKFFNLSPDLLCVATIGGYFERVNPAFTQILGYTNEELQEKPFVNFVHPDDVDLTLRELDKLANNTVTIHFENRCCSKAGIYHWFSWKAFHEIETGLLYAIARDITEKKALEDQLLELTRLDPLTEVYNRRAFTEFCKQEIKLAAKQHYPISMIIIDVDYFKEFNDSKGHIQGDKILRKVSQTLQKNLRKRTDNISRYGGDEFLVLLSHTNLKQAINVAEHLRQCIESLNIPYQIGKKLDVLTITLGVTTIMPDKDYSVNRLIAIADAALYKAKKAGRNQVIGMD